MRQAYAADQSAPGFNCNVVSQNTRHIIPRKQLVLLLISEQYTIEKIKHKHRKL